MAFQGPRLQYILAVVAATAWVLQGYDQALMNGLLTLPSFESTFKAIDTSTPELKAKHSTLEGTAVALYEVGAAIGALACFFIGEKFGRKKTTLAGACCVLIGVVLQATAFSLAQLIVARIVTGLGVGSFTATLPTWVGESVNPESRGWLVMLEGSAAIFGVMFVGWMEFGFFFVPNNNEVAWRFPIAFQAVFALAVLIIAWRLPESPRWLISKDRLDDARKAISLFQRETEDSEVVGAHMQVVRNAIALEQEGHSSNPFARTRNNHLYRTLIAIATNILAQMSGINVITFYSNTIFEEYLGYSGTLSRIISSCLQTWQFLAATFAVVLIDRFGRRKLFITCAFLMAVANAGLAGLQSHSANHPTIAGCSLIFYFLALGSFPIGMFLIPFMYASEIAPLKVRSQICAMSAAFNWLFNFLVAEVTPHAFASIGWKYYLVFVCTNSLSVVFFYLFAPETRNRTLEDIDAIFLSSHGLFQPVKTARTLPDGIAEEFDLSAKGGAEAMHKEQAI